MPALGFPLAGELGGGDALDELNNISKLLLAFSTPIQDFWNAGLQIEQQLDLENAIGINLDLKGALVDEPRQGLDDDTYRRRIRARIAVHRSTSTVEDLLRIADLIIFEDDAEYFIQTQGGGTVYFRVDGVAVATELATVAHQFLQQAAGVAVRVIFQYNTAPPSGRFRFDVGPGFGIGRLDSQIG